MGDMRCVYFDGYPATYLKTALDLLSHNRRVYPRDSQCPRDTGVGTELRYSSLASQLSSNWLQGSMLANVDSASIEILLPITGVVMLALVVQTKHNWLESRGGGTQLLLRFGLGTWSSEGVFILMLALWLSELVRGVRSKGLALAWDLSSTAWKSDVSDYFANQMVRLK